MEVAKRSNSCEVQKTQEVAIKLRNWLKFSQKIGKSETLEEPITGDRPDDTEPSNIRETQSLTQTSRNEKLPARTCLMGSVELSQR